MTGTLKTVIELVEEKERNSYDFLDNLYQASKLLLDELGINTPTVRLTTLNSSRTLGQTRKLSDQFEVAINSSMINNAPVLSLIETMVHELLHTLPNCFNHGPVWKGHVSKVNATFGTSISRLTTVNFDIGQQETYKYKVTCNGCNKVVATYKRLGKVLKSLEEYTCGICGGELTASHI